MILVTGGAGYIGTPLVRELLGLGERVRVVDTFWFGNAIGAHDRLELITGDVRRPDPAWLDDVDAVIHLSGLSNDPTADFAPELNNEANVMATRELARMVAEKSAREGRGIRFLFASSCSVYYTSTGGLDVNVAKMTEECPIAPTANYSKTKRLAEIELLRLADQYPFFSPVILRKGTLFGYSPRMRFDLVVNVFTLHAWANRRLTVHGSGEAWRPLLHVRDAVDAYIHTLQAPAARVRGEIFNLVHKNYRILELAHWVAEVLEQQHGVEIQVKRQRGAETGNRSYYVVGDKIARTLGFQAERGTARAVLDIWDALERGEFGPDPLHDPRFFNIRALEQSIASGDLTTEFDRRPVRS